MSSQQSSEVEAYMSSTTSSARPTEEKCWKDFWTKMATIWASLPPAVQRECIEEAEEPESFEVEEQVDAAS